MGSVAGKLTRFGITRPIQRDGEGLSSAKTDVFRPLTNLGNRSVSMGPFFETYCRDQSSVVNAMRLSLPNPRVKIDLSPLFTGEGPPKMNMGKTPESNP